MAAGDSTGNLQFFDLLAPSPEVIPDFKELLSIQAHDSDVSALDFAQTVVMERAGDAVTRRYCLASGSRDKLTHMYYIKVTTPGEGKPKGVTYENLAVFDDHLSTVSGLRIVEERSTQGKRRLKLVTSGADKLLVVRQSRAAVNQDLSAQKSELFEVDRKESYAERVTAMDVTADAGYLLTAHDRTIQLQMLHKTNRKGHILWTVNIPEAN